MLLSLGVISLLATGTIQAMPSELLCERPFHGCSSADLQQRGGKTRGPTRTD